MNHLPITTVILAGGRGSRIGGDKGLQLLHGRPLIAWVLDAVSKQGDEILISANGNRAAYSRFGKRVITDRLMDWAGPLAGLQAAMQCAQHDWVASVPCDTPFLPDDLIAELFEAANTASSECAVAVAGGRRQPTIALYRKSVLPRLDEYLGSGARKVGDWLDQLQVREALFDDESVFFNINSSDELAAANQAPRKA